MGAFSKMPGFANSRIGQFIARRTKQVSGGSSGGVTPTLVTTPPPVQNSVLYGG